VHALPKAFPEHAVAPYHHDMKPEHVLIHGGRSTLIDVEGIALGDPALDIGNMLARISAACWLNGASLKSCKLAMMAFLDGLAPMPERRLAAAYALGKMKTATFAVSHQIEDWAQIASCEIDSAINALHSTSLQNAL
jgi:aminoglycoside phosphotransferase (APT) family kinase protein